MSVTKLICDICDQQFSTRFCLKRHVTYMHEKSKEIICEICSKKFARPDQLNHHKRFHGVMMSGTGRNLFKCPVCFDGVSRYHISDHFLKHEITLKSYSKKFINMNEFQKWKQHFEEIEKSRFVKPGKSFKRVDGTKVHPYVCHRSGFYCHKGTGKRRVKTCGSNKINCHCPAEIRAVETRDGRVTAFITETHVGHTIDIGRLPISRRTKEDIASKIASNIPFDKILDDYRDKTGDSLQRTSLITKRDLHNIASSYSMKHEAIGQHNDYYDEPSDSCLTEDNDSDGMALEIETEKDARINTVCNKVRSVENELSLDERIELIKLCCERICKNIKNEEQATYLEKTLLPMEVLVSNMGTALEEGIKKLKRDSSKINKMKSEEGLKSKSKEAATNKKSQEASQENLWLTITSEGLFLS